MRSRKKWIKAWNEFSKVKKAAEKEFAKGDMTPNQYTKKVKPVLDKACNTSIYD